MSCAAKCRTTPQRFPTLPNGFVILNSRSISAGTYFASAAPIGSSRRIRMTRKRALGSRSSDTSSKGSAGCAGRPARSRLNPDRTENRDGPSQMPRSDEAGLHQLEPSRHRPQQPP
jgi:hypothetical protein